MRTVAIVQARMTSTRLPGKILRPILGRPMLALLVERLQRARRLDGVVVATTVRPTDDPVEALTRQLGVGCFRGSEDDVLDRVVRAARAFDAELIVEITGDCPLIDPGVIDELVDTFAAHDVDYVSNVLERTYPRGLDTQVFPTRVLEEVARLTQDPVDREHVSLYIYAHPERFRLLNVASGLPADAAALRLTVDTIEDLDLIRTVYEELYPLRPDFRLADVLSLFEERPSLRDINRDVQQKAVPGATR